MNLEELRKQIDGIDEELVKIFEKRMKTAAEIADVKRKENIPVLNTAREREIIANLTEKTDKDISVYIRILYSLLFEMSRSYQHKLLDKPSELYEKINKAIESSPKLLPDSPLVACQGTEGAYSQMACEKVFNAPNIMYFNNFEGVFSAVENNFCEYGIIPIENSTSGSVNQIYDLMLSHKFFITKSVRVKIDHCLLANKGTKLENIKKIYSKDHAINQCSEFLSKLSGVEIIPVENTAIAAKTVAQSGRDDVAAISSHMCKEIYNLISLENSIQDKDNNYTRFICITKNLQILPGADKTSLMLTLPHKPGALYKTLAKVYALGINLIKLESRPIPQREFEFMFYFDLETSVYSEQFAELICQIGENCETFAYLGSYSEII